MTARELAHSLRAVRQTNDVAVLRSLALRAVAASREISEDTTETLLWAIAQKVVRLERLN